MLEFKFQDVLNEIQAFADLAEAFLEPSSLRVLAELSGVLENVRDTRSSKTVRWEIPDDRPLVTRASFGAYQPDAQGAHNIFAEVSSVWEIKRIAPQKKKNRAELFALDGLASTRIRLFRRLPDGNKGESVAMWRTEIGDMKSPGCHFHFQILGEDDNGPFPKSVDVPRLPSVLATPLTITEFVLGELFQDEWAMHAAAQSSHLKRWIPIQKRRLLAVMGWQHDVVHNAAGSPWATLKQEKPTSGLFLN